MRKPFLGGNWKMNADSHLAQTLAHSINAGVTTPHADVVLFPSGVYLEQVRQQLVQSYCKIGAQNVCEYDQGAYTGEIAAYMLADMGCAYVLVGHSERRHIYGESNDTVAAKYQRALEQSLTPVLCVGETLHQKQSDQVNTILTQQVQAVIQQSGINSLEHGVIAYEPVWAIGTGEVATQDAINHAHQMIRQYLKSHSQQVAESVRIVYGGSVKPDNASAIFSLPEVDGGLIGGASLKADSFLALYNQLIQ